MPIICIGPVCIPWTALFPIICVLLRPIYNVMPLAVQEKLDLVYDWFCKVIDAVTPAFLKKKKKKAKRGERPANKGKIIPTGEIVGLECEHDFFATTEATEVLVYFTATWCKPCQQIKPAVSKIATTTSLRVMSIDVDMFQDIQDECTVTAMPTFILFANGKEISRSTGAVEANLEVIVKDYIKQQ
eukprot:TRINITY_DN55_c2_g1_i1.p1 TRINITY_DN55_c2_g1~~TRINITY_DN55_c2_g1_i1.p1  ORF type:complete len:186 (+),score=31.41 TRINITY_DN55_c2_g1_i1:62-619(+)